MTWKVDLYVRAGTREGQRGTAMRGRILRAANTKRFVSVKIKYFRLFGCFSINLVTEKY